MRTCDSGREKMCPIIGGSASENAVEIVGEALGFHQRFTAAIGATTEIGMRYGLIVEGFNELFGVDGGEMESAVTEVGDFFRMTIGPGSIGAFGLMAGVAGGTGVTVIDVVGH